MKQSSPLLNKARRAAAWLALLGGPALPLLASAQAPAWNQAFSPYPGAPSTATSAVRAMALGSDGARYIAGSFAGTARFGTINLTSAGSDDGFIAAQAANGTWLWAVQVGGTGSESVNGIALDSNGNVIVAGGFAGSITLGATALTSIGGSDGFVGALNSSGAWQWARRGGGIIDDAMGAVAVDGSNNVYVVGTGWGNQTFTATALTVAGSNYDGYVGKLNSSGAWQWISGTGGAGNVGAATVAVDGSGNAYVGGSFNGSGSFGSTSLAASGEDAWLSKLNTSGAWQWTRQIGSSGNDYTGGVAVEAATGTAYWSGQVATSATFGTTTLTANSADAMLAKISTAGTWQWALQGGGSGADAGAGISLSGTNLYWTGSYTTSGTFGATSLSGTAKQVFLGSLTNAGTWNWVKQAGGSGNDEGIDVDHAGGVTWVSGTFTGSATFDALSLSGSASGTTGFLAATLIGAPATTGASRCGSGTLTLQASGAPGGGSYRWYTVASGGTAISGATGSSYTTPTLYATTTYYVSALDAQGNESSTRTPVTATVAYSLPVDISASGPTALFTGGSVSLTARPNLALSFTGANSASSQRVMTNLSASPADMPSTTWEAWVYPTRVNYGVRQTVFSVDNGGYDRTLIIEANTANWGVFTGSGVWQPVAVDLNQWQHVAVVYSPTGIKFYKNGVEYSLSSPNLGTTTNRFAIGANADAAWFQESFQGQIDEVRVWNTLRTQAQLQATMYSVPAGNTAGLAGYWRFNEGTGTTAIDVTGNNNGILTNSPTYVTPGQASILASTYNWSPATGLSATNTQTVTASPASTQSYTVAVTDNNSCAQEVQQTVTVQALATAPTGTNLTFNGTTDGIDLPENGNLVVGAATSFTIETWVRASSAPAGGDMIYSQQRCSDGAVQLLIDATGAVRLRVNSSLSGGVDQSLPGPVITNGQWHHVAGVRDVAADQLRLYVDGQLVQQATDNTSGALSNPTTENWIGQRFNCSQRDYFTGKLDDFRYWTVARTQNEIQSGMNTAPAANSTGLVLWYDMEQTGQGSGLTVLNRATATGSTMNGVTVGTATTPVFTPTVTWTGAVSTDWFIAGNWTGGLPTAVTDVLIPAGAPRYPSIGSGTASTLNISLQSGASLTMTGGTLNVNGTWVNDGTFSAPAGGVAFSGSGAQSIGGSSTTRFWNLGVGSAGASLGSPVSVQRLLTLAGNLTTSAQPFTLESTPTLTAMVVNSGGSVVGTATVQRAITPGVNAGPGYRHYSAPVNGSTVADLATAGFTPVVNPAYNNSATPNLVTPFPTVFGYDQSRLSTATNNLGAFDKGWFSPSALTDPLAVGRGYTVNIPASQTVDFTGTLTNGDVALSLARNSGSTAADAGWQLVGNPYPSPLDWSAVAPADRPNLDASMYVFESSSQYAGTYRSYVNGVGDPIVSLGQGFFVRVSTGQTSGSLTFRNAQRSTTFTAATFRRGQADTRPQLQLDLQGAGLSDKLYVYAESGATAGADAEFDAVKLPNTHGLNLSATAATGESLAIQGLPALSTATVVPLSVQVPQAGRYTFTAPALANWPATTQVVLVDNLTGTRTALAAGTSYAFSLAGTTAPGRFWLNLTPAATPLASTQALEAQVLAYPNPAHSQLTVLRPAGAQVASVELLNSLGQRVRHLALPTAETPVDLRGLASGVYTLRLTLDGMPVSKRIVIE